MPQEHRSGSHMGRRHYRIRADIRARMRLWHRAGLSLWWCTLTSAPGSPPARLRKDWQAWRKRLARELEIDSSQVQYAMVDTSEGHGVLHFILALPPGVGQWLDYRKLGEWWQEIHGARQVKFRPIGRADSDIRKLSQYIVSQYMVGGQGDALGRYSGSRMVAPIGRWRKALMGFVCARDRARSILRGLSVGPTLAEWIDAWKSVRREQFTVFRVAWDDLLSRGWCSAYGERWCLVGDRLEEV